MAGIDMKSLMGLVGSDGIEALAKSTKTDKSKVTAVLSDALPVLVGKMSDNASTKDGAESLNKALNEHKTGDTIDAAAFLASADSDDGKKILGHILGSDEAAATKAISKKSGVSGKKVGTILSTVAPLLLSQLGNKKDDDSSAGIGGLLGGLLGGGSQSSSGSIGSTLLGSLLGGGSSSSSSSSSGGLFGGLLGGLLGGKEEEKEEKKEEESGGLLGGLGSLAMNLFGDSSALSESTSGKKKTGKKTGTSSAKKKTGTTSGKKTGTTASGKKTAAKKPASSTAKKTGTTATGKKTAAKKPASSTAKKTGTTATGKKTAKKTTGK